MTRNVVACKHCGHTFYTVELCQVHRLHINCAACKAAAEDGVPVTYTPIEGLNIGHGKAVADELRRAVSSLLARLNKEAAVEGLA